MPKAGTIVSHLVGWTRDVAGLCYIAEVALVDAAESEEVCSRAGGSSGVFVVPHYTGDVVAERQDSSASAIDLLGYDVLLGN